MFFYIVSVIFLLVFLVEHYYAPRKTNVDRGTNGKIRGAYSRRVVRPSVRQSVSQSVRTSRIRVRPITLLVKVGFQNNFAEMITILGVCVARKFGSLPWRSRSQNDLAAKSCPAYNFVILGRISKIFHRNDHHIETTCRAQHLGRYLES